jgi:hypothetical protein
MYVHLYLFSVVGMKYAYQLYFGFYPQENHGKKFIYQRGTLEGMHFLSTMTFTFFVPLRLSITHISNS